LKGKPYKPEELEAALEAQSTLSERLADLDKRQAGLDRFKDKSKIAEVLKEFGHNLDDVAVEHILALKAQEDMDPKDRELAELKAYKESQERARQEAEAKQKEAEEAEIHQRNQEILRTQVLDAAKQFNLPNTARAAEMVMEEIGRAAKLEVDLPPPVAVQIVKERLTKEFGDHVRTMDAAGIKNLLPKPLQAELLKLLTNEALAPTTKAPDSKPKAKPVPGQSSPLPDHIKKMFDF